MYSIDFSQLEIFIKVYEAKNFSLAANALHLTQPTVSARISQIEKELGVLLFRRTTKTVVPTDEANYLYIGAKKLLNDRIILLDDFFEHFENSTTINIGASTIPCDYLLANTFDKYKSIHPHVKFNLTRGHSEDILDKLKNDIFNIAFVGHKIDDDTIDFIPFMSDSLVFILPNTPEYRSIVRGRYPLKVLLGKPIILRKKGDNISKISELFLKKLGYTEENLNIIARINELDKIKNLVKSENGISLLSNIAAQKYKENGEILIYKPSLFPMRRYLYIATIKNKTLSVDENIFLKFLYKIKQ